MVELGRTPPVLAKQRRLNVLHTTKPADYIPIEKLAEPARCPECNELLVVSAGGLHLRPPPLARGGLEGLIRDCSDMFFLSFAPSSSGERPAGVESGSRWSA